MDDPHALLTLLSYYRYRFHFKALEAIRLPTYPGALWRGSFGYTLRKIVCLLRQADCKTCLLKSQCLYIRLFETPNMTEVGAFDSGSTHLPHPFILVPPLEYHGGISAGATFTSELVLLKPALSALPYIILTIQAMGERGIHQAPFELTHVELQQGDSWQTIFDGNRLIEHTQPSTPILPVWQTPPTQLTLHTLTPLRIKQERAYVKTLTFKTIFTALMRRLNTLTGLYTPTPLNFDNLSLLTAAEQILCEHSDLSWTELNRFSHRQKSQLKFGGLEGSVRYQGELSPFLPWLLLGEMLHVGSLTSFGLGRYRLIWQE